MSDRTWEKWPMKTEIIEGDPIRVAGRELAPFVRVMRHTRRRARVGNEGVAGEGLGVVHMSPVAVVDRSASDGRRLPFRDRTTESIKWLLLVALIVPCLASMLIHLSRRS